jgi:hypothetical protein
MDGKRRNTSAAWCFGIVLSLSLASQAPAQETHWTLAPPAIGDWLEPANWDNGVPGSGWSAGISNGGIARVERDAGDLDTLQVGYQNDLLNRLRIRSGGIAVNTMYIGNEGTGDCLLRGTAVLEADTMYLGYELDAKGTFTQTGGTCTVADTLYIGYRNIKRISGHPQVDESVYYLEGGQFTATNVGMGTTYYGWGKGALIQTGGYAHITDTLTLTDYSYYTGTKALAGATCHLGGGDLVVDGEIRMGRAGWTRLEWFGGTLTVPTVRMFRGRQSALVMGLDFSVDDLAGGSLPPGTTFVGLDSATLEVTNGATATHAANELVVGQVRIGTPQGGGTYEISGTGRLTATYGAAEGISVGYGGDGVLHVAGAPGVVNVSAALSIRVGHGGRGEVVHSGGIVDTPSVLVSSPDPYKILDQGEGSYLLTGAGELRTQRTYVNGDSDLGVEGLFVQDGGVHQASEKVRVGGSGSDGLGRYEMRDGLLETGDVVVGRPNYDFHPEAPYPGSQGTFVQTGGTVRADHLEINSVSKYVYVGGVLDVGSMTAEGEVDFGGAAVSLNVPAGAADLSKSGFTNSANASLTCGDFLLMAPPGYDPYTAFASFSTAGLVHTLGETLVVPEDVTLRFGEVDRFEVPDHVDCRGVIEPLPGRAIWLRGGLSVRSGAHVGVDSLLGLITIADVASGISGGRINAAYMYVGYDDEQALPAQFTQTSGLLTLAEHLTVGYQAQAGRFVLAGGECTVRSLRVGSAPSGYDIGFGTFEILGSDGVLSAEELSVGSDDFLVAHVTRDGISTVDTLDAWFGGTLKVIDDGAPNGRWVVVDAEYGFDQRPTGYELPSPGWSYGFAQYGGSGEQLWIERVPEPATLALLATGLGVVIVRKRRV